MQKGGPLFVTCVLYLRILIVIGGTCQKLAQRRGGIGLN